MIYSGCLYIMATDDISDAYTLIDDTLACARLSMFKKTSVSLYSGSFEPDGLKCLVREHTKSNLQLYWCLQPFRNGKKLSFAFLFESSCLISDDLLYNHTAVNLHAHDWALASDINFCLPVNEQTN